MKNTLRYIHVEGSCHQTAFEGKAASIVPIPGLPTGHQFSVEERRLNELNPVRADVIREPVSIGGGVGWKSFNRDIVELETKVLYYLVVGSGRVPTTHPKPFTGIDQDWNTWWKDFTLDIRAITWDEQRL